MCFFFFSVYEVHYQFLGWVFTHKFRFILAPILKLCQKNDPNLTECLRKVVETIRPNLTAGIPDLLIPPCEPLKIPEIRIVQNAGAIRMESEYNNVIISGLSNFTLRDIDVDAKKGCIRADLWFPSLGMKSNYAIHGNILLMPITGSGNAYGNFCKLFFLFSQMSSFHSKDTEI